MFQNPLKSWLRLTQFALVVLFPAIAQSSPENFSANWQFLRADESQAASPSFDAAKWETVTLPHTARVEALVAGKNNPQWQGICWYRKTFELPDNAKDKVVILKFDGAMNVAEV